MSSAKSLLPQSSRFVSISQTFEWRYGTRERKKKWLAGRDKEMPNHTNLMSAAQIYEEKPSLQNILLLRGSSLNVSKDIMRLGFIYRVIGLRCCLDTNEMNKERL